MHADRVAGPVESLSAVTLVVAAMDAAVGFYLALGFALAYGGPDAAFTSFRIGRSFLNLQLDSENLRLDRETRRKERVWGRVIFWVDDVDAAHARAVASGFTPFGEPIDAPWGERYFHIRDPDGHELSFARPLATGRPDQSPNGNNAAGKSADRCTWLPGKAAE